MAKMNWPELIEEVVQQQSCLDLLTAAWLGEYAAAGGKIYCGRGCSGCCSLAVSTTLTEAVAIARTLDDSQRSAVHRHAELLRAKVGNVADLKGYLRMHRQEAGPCPLLTAEGVCGVYGSRPLSCRALLSTRESRWCGVDFSLVSAEEKRAFLESLDQAVVAFPLHYVATTREMGQEMEAQACRRLMEQLGFSLYGSLPVLLHLVTDHGLAEACGNGYKAAQACVRRSGFDNRFLLSWQVQ